MKNINGISVKPIDVRIHFLYFFMLFMITAEGQTGQKQLINLYRFEDKVDSLNGCLVTQYPILNLIHHENEKSFVLYIKNKSFFRGDYEAFTYRYEVFDTSYLLISVYKGVSPAAVPDNYSRDSVFIVNLNSQQIRFVNAAKFYLIKNKSDLLENYTPTKNLIRSKIYAAIEKIDFDRNEIVIIDQNQTTHVIKLNNPG